MFFFLIKRSGFCAATYSTTWNVTSRLDILLPEGQEMLMPGEHAVSRVTLLDNMPMVVGQTFTMRENKRTVVSGMITKVFDRINVNKAKINEAFIPGISTPKIAKSKSN